MKGYRQAAVALHGLNQDDQAWLLGELEASQRETLDSLIRELDELGFAKAPALKDAAAEDGAAPAAGPHAAIAGAHVEDLLAILEREPALLVAQVLRAGDWPWTEAFVAALAAPRRAAVRAAADGIQAAPARDRFLIEQLAARAGRRQASAQVQRAPQPSMKERIRRWIR